MNLENLQIESICDYSYTGIRFELYAPPTTWRQEHVFQYDRTQHQGWGWRAQEAFAQKMKGLPKKSAAFGGLLLALPDKS